MNKARHVFFYTISPPQPHQWFCFTWFKLLVVNHGLKNIICNKRLERQRKAYETILLQHVNIILLHYYFFVNILLCLIYKLNSIIYLYIGRNSPCGIWYYLFLSYPLGVPQIRDNYCHTVFFTYNYCQIFLKAIEQ